MVNPSLWHFSSLLDVGLYSDILVKIGCREANAKQQPLNTSVLCLPISHYLQIIPLDSLLEKQNSTWVCLVYLMAFLFSNSSTSSPWTKFNQAPSLLQINLQLNHILFHKMFEDRHCSHILEHIYCWVFDWLADLSSTVSYLVLVDSCQCLFF